MDNRTTEVKVGGPDPVSAGAHHRGALLCCDRWGDHLCTRQRGHPERQHVAWSAESGRVLAVWVGYCWAPLTIRAAFTRTCSCSNGGSYCVVLQ